MNTNDLPTVTEVLAPYSNFEAISPAVLDAAIYRGKIVHEAILSALCPYPKAKDYEEGEIFIDWMVLNSIQYICDDNPNVEKYSGFLKSFTSWFSSVEIKRINFLEHHFVNSSYGFQGKPDLVCQFTGDNDNNLTVIDWKTSAVLSKSWDLQLAGYSLLVEDKGYEIKSILAIRLKKNGSGFIVNDYTYQLKELQNKFLGAVNLYNHFYGNGEYITWPTHILHHLQNME